MEEGAALEIQRARFHNQHRPLGVPQEHPWFFARFGFPLETYRIVSMTSALSISQTRPLTGQACPERLVPALFCPSSRRDRVHGI